MKRRIKRKIMEKREIVDVTKKKSAAGFLVATIMMVLYFIAQTFIFGGAENFGFAFTAIRVGLSFAESLPWQCCMELTLVSKEKM